MQKKSNRWLIWIFVIIAVVALIGFSFGAIFDSLVSNRPSPSPSIPSPGAPDTAPSPATVSDIEKKNLQDLENGYLLILKKEPDNADALQGLVETRSQMIPLGLKKVNDLVEPLERLVQLNPEQTKYKVVLAQTLQRSGQRETAAQTYRTILATQPGNMDALQGFVTLLIEQQRSSSATELLETTLTNASEANKVKPNSINETAVKLLLGQTYVSQKQFDSALALYDKLIATDPKDFRPVFAKAILLKEQGKTKKSQILFKSAQDLAPGQYKDQIKAAANTPSSLSSSPQTESSSPTLAPNP